MTACCAGFISSRDAFGKGLSGGRSLRAWVHLATVNDFQSRVSAGLVKCERAWGCVALLWVKARLALAGVSGCLGWCASVAGAREHRSRWVRGGLWVM